MALVIRNNGFFESRRLKIEPNGILFNGGEFLKPRRRFAFREIVCVLMSRDRVLSFQAGASVFSIRTRPDKDKDRQVIEALLAGVRRA